MEEMVRLQARVYEAEYPNLYRFLINTRSRTVKRSRVLQILEAALASGVPSPQGSALVASLGGAVAAVAGPTTAVSATGDEDPSGGDAAAATSAPVEAIDLSDLESVFSS